MTEHFLTTNYHVLHLQREQRSLARATILAFLLAAPLYALSYCPGELIRTLAIIPFCIAATCGTAYFIHTLQLRRSMKNAKCSMLNAQCKHPSVPSVPLW